MIARLFKYLPFIVAAFFGGMIASWFGRKAPEPTGLLAPPALAYAQLRVPTVEVTQTPTAARFRLGGYVEPRNFVRLTAQQPGRIAYIAGQEGEHVRAGQLVAALDDDAIRPQYRAAWAALGAEMAAQQNAQTQLYQKLYGPRQPSLGGPGYDAYERYATPFYNMFQSFMGNGGGFPGFSPGGGGGPGGGPPMMTQDQAQRSWSAVNNARADYERQQAGLAGAQARVDELDQQLRNRRSIAPYNSVIMMRHVRVGDVVQPGQPLVDIADTDQLDVRVELPAHLVGNLKIGDQIPVSLSNANVWAAVSQIFPGANPAQRTVTVKLALQQGAAAAPGMYALVWFAQPGGGGPSASAPSIPTSAIAWRGSLPIAFVVSNTGAADMRILRLGEATGDRTAVLSGLQTGEKILANPNPNQRSGESVLGGMNGGGG
ncbi:MAG: efflux RND transporter periplasmic adaptor subunit [Hyphomicrobiales bacterium]|nr:efflux RND transporter periplasmic adaptor subunit [Hyphomicrobiales bacterium]